MNKLFFAAASVVALGLFGCAADTSSPDTESSSSAIRSQRRVVGEFAHCGGNIRNAPVCAAGLKCDLALVADLGGICVKDGWGDHCGGNIVNPPTCQAGLECVLTVSNPDVGGTCDYAQYGQSCGGFMASAVECGAGLQCSHVTANGTRINPDLPGVCLEGSGQACGGNMTTAKACAGGLTCTGRQPVGDFGGTCQ